jgi:hypothetical protein
MAKLRGFGRLRAAVKNDAWRILETDCLHPIEFHTPIGEDCVVPVNCRELLKVDKQVLLGRRSASCQNI